MTTINDARGIADKIIECMQMDGDTDAVEMFLDQYVEQGASRGEIIVALELAQEKLRADALVSSRLCRCAPMANPCSASLR